ncbi:DUF6084 family protein [soil metagenome]
MSELSFDVVSARVEPYAAVPTLAFGLRVAESTGARVDAIVLRCQIRIEPQRRAYDEQEAERLVELFGGTKRWGSTLKPFLWTHVVATVPRFTGATDVDLHVPCSYELEVAAARYLHALGDEGEVPLVFLFSGSVFTRAASGMSVEQVPWHKEADYRLPARMWRTLMDTYYPGGGWLRLSRETIDALAAFKARRAIPTWDDTVTALLATAEVDA